MWRCQLAPIETKQNYVTQFLMIILQSDDCDFVYVMKAAVVVLMLHHLMRCMFSLQQYARRLRNFNAEQPHKHAVYYTSVVMSELSWTQDELLEALEGSLCLFRTLNKYEVICPLMKDKRLTPANIDRSCFVSCRSYIGAYQAVYPRAVVQALLGGAHLRECHKTGDGMLITINFKFDHKALMITSLICNNYYSCP